GSDNGTIDMSNGHAVPVACDLVTSSNAVNRDYAQPVCSALDSDQPWLQVANGFAGQSSDGLVQLDGPSHIIATPATNASNGNLAQTVQADLTHGGAEFTLALGFGQNPAVAAHATNASLNGR